MADFFWEHLTWWPPLLVVCASAVLGASEAIWPRQLTKPVRMRRWPVNLGLYATGLGLVVWGAGPLNDAAIRWGAGLGWGGVAAAPWPDAAKVLLGLVVIDLLQYFLHRLSHAVPLLWRLHQVHHADEQFDVSTSVRHHPLETLVLSVFTLMGCAALGVPVLSLMMYLSLQIVHAGFCHSNLAVPPRADLWLRQVVVTPDMHRIHHSVHEREGQRNFALIFPWWDRLFGTYQETPADGHLAMRVGLPYTRRDRDTGWWGSLILPIRVHPPPAGSESEDLLRPPPAI